PDLAASVTFYIVFALPAGTLAFVSLLGFSESLLGEDLAGDARQYALDFVETSLGNSPALIETVNALFDQQRLGLVTVGLAVALWALSRAFAGIIRALNLVYDLEVPRVWGKQRLVALATSVALLLGLGTAMFAVSQGVPTIALFPVVVVAFATLYHSAPNHVTPWRSDVPGALLTSAGWALVLRGFGLYIDLSSEGNSVLTTIASGLAFLTLIYLLMVILLVGGEFNAVLLEYYKRTAETAAKDTIEESHATTT
ncbi:MAG: YihY/virulence factor BrkB family protein, partial [Acidimicrobiales bacterium]